MVEQANRLAKLEDAFRVALMPDAHPGERAPNGCVLATYHRIYPEAIGRDIGCGVSAIRFDSQFDSIPQSLLLSILADLDRTVPSLKLPSSLAPKTLPDTCPADQLSAPHLVRLANRDGLMQLGTLGRGNHFIELGLDQFNYLWALVHSGSRGMGQAITDWHLLSASPSRFASLEFASDHGQAYFSDLLWGMRYASENRLWMLNRLADSVDENLGATVVESSYIDSHHNFARNEMHFGRYLIVHRKSANSARCGEIGIIPGSMAAGSRIVVGRGNADSLHSSSHGAGRTMSRSEAFSKIRVKNFNARMGSIVFRREHATRLLDEAPEAYRCLNQVMKAQRDLVTTRDTLRTVLNYKSV